jgi:histidinol-phosphate aminotransferase
MFRQAIERMTAYTPGEQPRPGQRLVKLNTNENPYPPSPRARRAVAAASAGAVLRLYPPPRSDPFIEAASRLYRIPRTKILAGNGSDELLAMLFRAALGPGDTVAYAVPTYSLYDTLAAVQEAKVLNAPVAEDYAVPVDLLARARARLTIVCNPNSPTGTIATSDALDFLARRLDGRLLAIDEAYVDFADTNALPLIKRRRNVVVLRSLSKSFSLAGMRLGLCFADAPIIEALLKVKDSYNLSRVALAAGAEALADAAWMRRNVERVRNTRVMTEARLRRMGFEVPPSSANFVFARLPGRNLGPLAVALRRCGILVRHFPNSLFSDGLRITIGTRAEMAALFKALEAVMKPALAARRNGRTKA